MMRFRLQCVSGCDKGVSYESECQQNMCHQGVYIQRTGVNRAWITRKSVHFCKRVYIQVCMRLYLI